MADTEAIKQAVAQTLVTATKAMVLAISKEGRRNNTHSKKNWYIRGHQTQNRTFLKTVTV